MPVEVVKVLVTSPQLDMSNGITPANGDSLIDRYHPIHVVDLAVANLLEWPETLSHLQITAFIWHHTIEQKALATLVLAGIGAEPPTFGQSSTFWIKFGEDENPTRAATTSYLADEDVRRELQAALRAHLADR